MVRVDYSDKNGGPQPIRDVTEDNANQGVLIKWQASLSLRVYGV